MGVGCFDCCSFNFFIEYSVSKRLKTQNRRHRRQIWVCTIPHRKNARLTYHVSNVVKIVSTGNIIVENKVHTNLKNVQYFLLFTILRWKIHLADTATSAL